MSHLHETGTSAPLRHTHPSSVIAPGQRAIRSTWLLVPKGQSVLPGRPSEADALRWLAWELFGLFIADRSLALATLGLLATIAVLMHEALMDKGLAAIVLVAGSILTLIENVVRTSRQSIAKQKLRIAGG